MNMCATRCRCCDYITHYMIITIQCVVQTYSNTSATWPVTHRGPGNQWLVVARLSRCAREGRVSNRENNFLLHFCYTVSLIMNKDNQQSVSFVWLTATIAVAVMLIILNYYALYIVSVLGALCLIIIYWNFLVRVWRTLPRDAM